MPTRMGTFAKNASWVAVGQGVSTLTQAGYFVVVTRLLGAAEFGLYATVVALVSVVSQYANLGSGYVLLRYGSINEDEIPVYWGNVLLSIAAFSLPVVGAVCAFELHNAHLASLELVATVAVSDCILLALVNAAAQAFQSRERMRASAALSLSTNLARLITASVLLVVLKRADSLQWARSVLASSSIVGFIAIIVVTRSFGWPQFRPSLLWKRAGEGLSFSLSLSTSALYNDLDKILLGRYGFLAATGTYTAAYRVLNAGTMPAYAIYSSAFPRFFRAGSESVGATVKLARKLLLSSTPPLLLVCAGIFLTAPYAAAAFGKGFGDTAIALRWLCLIPLLRSVQWSAADALSGLGRQNLRLILQLVAVGINLVLNIFLIPRYSWRGAAWSTLATDGSLAVMCWITLIFISRRGPLHGDLAEELKTLQPAPDSL